jgi:hypothetical protein
VANETFRVKHCNFGADAGDGPPDLARVSTAQVSPSPALAPLPGPEQLFQQHDLKSVRMLQVVTHCVYFPEIVACMNVSRLSGMSLNAPPSILEDSDASTFL